jgi:isopenicillin N synthase-like dioxygenase
MKIIELYKSLSFVCSSHWLLLMTLGISDPSKGIYACGAHSDFGMMTLLATDGVMGLQVLSSSDLLIYIRFDMTGLVM